MAFSDVSCNAFIGSDFLMCRAANIEDQKIYIVNTIKGKYYYIYSVYVLYLMDWFYKAIIFFVMRITFYSTKKLINYIIKCKSYFLTTLFKVKEK